MTLSLLIALLQSHEHSTVVTFGTLDTVRWPADLNGGDGDVALTALRASGELFHRLDTTNILRAVGGVERLQYDWSGQEGLPEELSVYRFEATVLHAFDARWKGVAQISSAFQFEEGAEVADGGA